ncbi:unnamed protein product [Phaedon cochleariae]|uniref:Uncharacterized protein n=1 Tax=Phaedon cochleariae TaxID=80249 RepID=A0A9P0DRU5_PHACE|nr:unnamed protein product [Phaedon cochleariae]
MEWNKPLTQKQLEDLIDDESFIDFEKDSQDSIDTSTEDKENCSDEHLNPETLYDVDKNCSDDQLLAAAKATEDLLLHMDSNDVTDVTRSIEDSAEIRSPRIQAHEKKSDHDEHDYNMEEPMDSSQRNNITEAANNGENEEERHSGGTATSSNNGDNEEEENFSEETATDSSNEENEEEINQSEETATGSTTPSEKKMLQSKCAREKYRYYREKGKKYKGYKKDNGKFSATIDRPRRVMLPKCSSKLCMIAKNRHCSEFSEIIRQTIFDKFWTLTWDMKKTYVSTLIDVKETKRPITENSRRAHSFEYHLKYRTKILQVCRKTFLNTLGLKESMVHKWCIKAESGMHIGKDDINLPLRRRITEGKASSLKAMTDFLKSIPKMESHYCRSSTSKLYVEPIYQSKMDLYRAYKIYCQDMVVEPVKPSRFKKEMDNLNIAIHSPKKDQCDLCVGYQTKNIDEEVYQSHIRRKNEARDAKSEDKALAQGNPEEIAVMTMDVQAVKLAPLLQASAIYFKTKLCVHNFTMYDLVTKDCHCYLWHEAEGGLEANIFCSIIYKHLLNYLDHNPRTKRIILYSDGCGYQNRNNCLANTILHIADTRKIVIEQKFLEKGHTQMEVDGAHSLIERKLKNQVINLPSDYIRFCESARQTKPFKVHYLSNEYFLNFSAITYYNTIRPGIRRLDPVIADIRCLKYENTDISFKLNHTDEYKLLRNKSKINTKEITKLYKGNLKIKKEKWNHLQALKSVLPKDTHSFYDSLQYQN